MSQSMEEHFNFLLASAESLHLRGNAHTKWVTEQMNAHRATQANLVREQADREERLRREEAERAEREVLRAHELDLATARASTPNTVSAHSTGDTEAPRPRERGPPVAMYEDHGKQPLDDYLRIFDQAVVINEGTEAERLRWLYKSMPPRLLSLLTSLSESDKKDYGKVKLALLASQNFSPAECRNRYLSCVPYREENCQIYGSRKERLFREWLKAAGVEECNVIPFLIWDAISHDLPPEVLAYVKGQLGNSSALQPCLMAADQFLAHQRQGTRLSEIIRSRRQDKQKLSHAIPPPNGQLKRSEPESKSGTQKAFHSNGRSKSNHHFPVASSKPSQTSAKQDDAWHPRKDGGQGQRPTQSQGQSKPRFVKNKGYKPSPSFQSHWQRSANAADIIEEDISVEDYDYTEHKYAATVTMTDPRKLGQGVPKCTGRVNGQDTNIVLDTGASGIFVDRRLVEKGDFTGRYVKLVMAEGPPRLRPCCSVYLDCRYYHGKAPAVALIDPFHPVLLGRMTNLAPAFKIEEYHRDIAEWQAPSPSTPPEDITDASAVSTRATVREETPAPIPANAPLDPLQTRAEFAKLQSSCTSLGSWRKKADDQQIYSARGGRAIQFTMVDGLLYRTVTLQGHATRQLVVPAALRKQAMFVAHHTPLSGHRGKTKTLKRLENSFVWPRMTSDVDRYVGSCHQCQVTSTAPVPKVPMGITKLSAEPFSQVAVDIVGPLNPASSSGKRFLLVYVDLATRYPDAIPLSSITTEAVAQALFEICSRVGFPEQITSDNGGQFTSYHFQGFCDLLEMRQITTSVYHAQSNGTCERFNGTLKRCLRKLVQDIPRQWDRFVPAALFAFRDTPHSTTGFAPFELIYGHKVRGPVEFLAECWSSPAIEQEDKDVHEYLLKFSAQLRTAWNAAHQATKGQQQTAKLLFDRRARRRALKPGDKALLLLPTDTRKLMLKWKGPFLVTNRLTPDHYILHVDGHNRRYHINQLKYYAEDGSGHRDPALVKPAPSVAEIRSTTSEAAPISGDASASENASNAPMSLCVMHYSHPLPPVTDDSIPETTVDLRTWGFSDEAPVVAATALAIEEGNIPFDDGKDPGIPTMRKEFHTEVIINPDLTQNQLSQLKSVLQDHGDTFNDLPGSTTAVEHKVTLTDKVPFRHSYAMPHQLACQLREDLQTWESLGIVERSNSPWCSPLLAVRKKDGTHRFCLDCRRLNARTVFDGEPIADSRHIFAQLAGARYLSKMDLASGFWQVSLNEETKPLTAFSTRYGLYQFRVMPFGMVNAPGCFSRLMRIVLEGLAHVSCFIDDILIHTKDWPTHIDVLTQVLLRLRQYGLHLKPSKCELGFQRLQYLGHLVGEGLMSPLQDKVKAIREMEKPLTVTQLRSFMGSVGYYQRFIPMYNTLAIPIFDLYKGTTRKSQPITWTDEAERAFCKLRDALAGEPVLQLIDPAYPFILQTDASDEGIGAVLLQARTDEPTKVAPVLYISRRLRPAERNYATVEKEALAAYWAIKKLEVYLYGRQFTLRTDHRPLLHLQTADKLNPKLKRWALYLNLFKFTAEHVEGSENHLADLLSRRALPDDVSLASATLALALAFG